MDAQQFLTEFGHIANAPDGITRLRQLVLQLAISGRLTAQAETDTPVAVTLAAVAVDRAAYEAKFELRAVRHHPPLETSPFVIPDHWKWVRLEQLVLYIQRGKGPKYAEHGAVSVVSQKCVQWSGFDITPARCIDDDSIDAYGKERFLRDGDLLWNSTGTGTAGRVAIVQGVVESRAVADSHVTVVRLASSLPRYVWCVIASPWVQARIQPTHSDSLVSGTTQQVELATSTARALAVPCPPVEEQGRIVAKVDELMALCDQLEQQQQDRRKVQNVLRQSTLQALAGAQSPHELQTSWQRLQVNFGKLFSEPGDVRDFKGLVLDLAVSGRLLAIPREPSSASELLEQIAEARSKWAESADGQEKKEATATLKKLRTQQVVAPSDGLPEHWRWASLLQISKAIVDCHNKTAPYVSEGIHLVRTTDIRDGRMDLTRTRKISEETYSRWAGRMPPIAGDIFFTREAPMGEAAIVPVGERVCLGQRTMLIRVFPELFSNRYLLYVIQSPSFQARMIEAAIGMTVKHLRVGGVEDLVVPVPPRDEQDDVVRIVDSLFALCDQHSEHLKNGLYIAANLATATVASLTGISIEQDEDTAVKAPTTELVAPLRLATPPDVKAQAPLATILARHQGEMDARDLWQRFGGEIDAFYAQLKTEVARGWVAEPEVAQVREKPAAEAARI
jgi:type I restriction enzyme S subunit